MYDPIPAHEDAHDRKLEAEQYAYELAREHYTIQIMETFTNDIRKTDPYRLLVQFVRSGTSFPSYQNISEAVSDMVSGDPEILRLLMDVLHASDCPLVEKLRKAMGEDYAKTWADVLASLGE